MKLDPRVLRTQRMFKDALAALIQREDYNDITITQIADEAGLRRATFYMHYRDKDELLVTILEDRLLEIEQQLEGSPDYYRTPEGARELDAMIFRYMGEHAAFFKAVLSGKGGAYAARFLRDYQMRTVIEKLKMTPTTMPLDVLAAYITGVKLQLIMWWLDNDMPYPPDEMGCMAADLAMNGLRVPYA